ncbi:MAG: NrsF family protein [Sphingomicrobium sp.]
MSSSPTDTLIDQLAADIRPVRPLRAPALRALMALAAIALVAGLAIALLGDVGELRRRYAGREALLALEMAAMLATGVLAVVAAFFLSIPGRSRRWIAAPVPPFAVWLLLSGLGCYNDFVRRNGVEWELGESMHCLLFILATSAALAPFLIWRLARAKPINPLPVALLGGLGVAAVSALVLQFFHPFTVTFVDLTVHLVAILIVIGTVGLVNRRALAPA